jgi:hypothetical protein|tara:strand:+ start:537 stop:920 length:384 start_codon:yes stop_codon:yes gene_type:complete
MMNKKMPGYKNGGSAAKSRRGPKSNNCGLFGRVQGKMNGGAMQPMGTTTTQPPQPMTTTPRRPIPGGGPTAPQPTGGGRAGGRGGNAPQRRGMKAAAPTEADIMNMKPRPPGLKGGGMPNIRNKKKR